MIQGNYNVKVVAGELGTSKKGQPLIKLDCEIVEGLHKGARVPYSGQFTQKAVRWTKRDMLQLGWKGETVTTAVQDIVAAGRIVNAEIVIASWKNPDTGETREWSTVRFGGSEPLKPLDGGDAKDVDKWLAEADGATGGKDDTIPF